MAAGDAREPSLREPLARRCSEIAATFEHLASSITEDHPEARCLELLRRTQALCESAALATGLDGETKSLLGNLKTAVETWRTVWPRLGRDPAFRSAVVREAGLWSRWLAARAGTSPTS